VRKTRILLVLIALICCCSMLTTQAVGASPHAHAGQWRAQGDQGLAHFGWSVGTAGDVNGDGFQDVIVGARYYNNGERGEGQAFVYQGSASGLGIAPAWTADGDQEQAYFGTSVATAGDVNGDGFDDVIVGAPDYDNGQENEGRAFVYLGSASGLGTTPAWTAEIDQAFAEFGMAVATAGDVNGDGFDDVIVGAWLTDEALVYEGSASGLGTTPAWTAESDEFGVGFGVSVATAGDVNGDGFDEVIVGAISYSHGQLHEGRAFVYKGSASGLGTAPAWTAESNQDLAHMGRSVATAGDVNGDGFDDVIVGAPDYDYFGRAFVYQGSAAGLGTTPAWTAEENQGGAQFAYSGGTAGDVNGDGFDDVIVGDYGYSNGQSGEGRALVFLGSPSGLSTNPASGAESNQEGASLGWSVGTAGDVNGDGLDDVIAGAPAYDNGKTGEGIAVSFEGKPPA
jgi:hypothetical protein